MVHFLCHPELAKDLRQHSTNPGDPSQAQDDSGIRDDNTFLKRSLT